MLVRFLKDILAANLEICEERLKDKKLEKENMKVRYGASGIQI